MEFIVKLFPILKFLTICYIIYKLGFIMDMDYSS